MAVLTFPSDERGLARRGSNAPLRPKVPQQTASTLGGLFGDDSKQIDLEDLIRIKE
jgi:hypothetical protein